MFSRCVRCQSRDAHDFAVDIPRYKPLKFFEIFLPRITIIIAWILVKIRLRVRLRLDETRSSVASSAAVLSRLTNVIRIQSEPPSPAIRV